MSNSAFHQLGPRSQVLCQSLSRCVVCTKSLNPSSLSTSTSKEEDNAERSYIFEESFRLKRALVKIFKYLAVKPEDEGTSVEALSEEWRNRSFCSKCFAIVDSVEKLHVKILELELLIQEKVETLGTVVKHSVLQVKHTTRNIKSLGSYDSSNINSQLPEVDAWTRIRKCVARRYDYGLLQNPRISLQDIAKVSTSEASEETKPEQMTVHPGDSSQETVVIPYDDSIGYSDENFDLIQPDNSDTNQPVLVLVAEIEVPYSGTEGTERQDSLDKVASRVDTEMDSSIKLPACSRCPKEGCDFEVPVVLSDKTKRTGSARKWLSVHASRNRVRSHYMNEHLAVKKEDVKKSKAEGFFYACHLCDFTVPVKSPGHGYKITYQPRLDLAAHYIRKHERPRKEDENIPRPPRPKKEKFFKPPKRVRRIGPAGPGPAGPAGPGPAGPAGPGPAGPAGPGPAGPAGPGPVVVTFVPETLYDTKNYGCPLCPFKPEFDDSWKGARRTVFSSKACSSLISHYSTYHLPVRPTDSKLCPETGKQYFQCTLCDYRVEKDLKSTPRGILARHYIKVHHGGFAETNEKEITTPVKKDKKSDGPSVTIPCPESTCEFSVKYVTSTDSHLRSKRKRVALLNLCKHCTVEHDYPDKPKIIAKGRVMVRDRCLQVLEDGSEVYKCYRCDLVLKVEYPVDCGDATKTVARLASFDQFMTHYIPHVLPKTEGIVSYKPQNFAEDKSVVLKAIKCQNCPFVMRKKSSWSCGDNKRRLAWYMKFNMKRHHRFEHPEIPFPTYRYYKRKDNLIKFNQEEFNSNVEEEVVDSDVGEDACPSDVEFELKPESNKRKKRAYRINKKRKKSETESETETEEEEEDEIDIKDEEQSDSESDLDYDMVKQESAEESS